MENMFNSCLRVERSISTYDEGITNYLWRPMPAPLNRVPCRLDLTYTRPGKDIPMPLESGRAPDRVGLLIYGPDVELRAGDRVVMIPNDYGEVPVKGIFEVRVSPDPIQGLWGVHHWEVQVIETAQNLANFGSRA